MKQESEDIIKSIEKTEPKIRQEYKDEFHN